MSDHENAAAAPGPEAQLTPPPTGNILLQAWLVILLGLCFGAALAGVHRWLNPIIIENQRQEALAQVPKLVPAAETGAEALVKVGDRELKVLKGLRGEELVGWVVPASGQGFADKIQLLVGLDARAETITGMYVVDQKETPGLGDAIRDPGFRAQFVSSPGRPMTTAAPILVSKDKAADNQILALSGATVSSRAVCDIINAMLAPELLEALRAEAEVAVTSQVICPTPGCEVVGCTGSGRCVKEGCQTPGAGCGGGCASPSGPKAAFDAALVMGEEGAPDGK